MTTTRIDYGNNLASPGVRQPNGVVSIDSYGLAQAQLTFALDSSASNLTDFIDTYSFGVAYPDDLGFDMKSYKVNIVSSEGGLAMATVDYMGISRGNGRTDAQISGIANTSAQPIETHPNFTLWTDETIGAGSATKILAGPVAFPSTNPNKPIFIPDPYSAAGGTFGGFKLSETSTRNPKAGVRQYLRPLNNFRGQMFFGPSNSAQAFGLLESVGDVLKIADLNILLKPVNASVWLSAPEGSLSNSRALLASANFEAIGSPEEPIAYKVTYDIMVGGDLGWDYDIYPNATTIF